VHAQITEHVWRVGDDALNVFLIVLREGVTLIDAGFPGTLAAVTETLGSLGRRPEEISDILVTHCHPDHASGLAEIKRATRARVWMHPADAALVREGKAFRPYEVTPEEWTRAYERDIIRESPQTFEPVEVEEEIPSSRMLAVADGIRALVTPGHTAGHLVFLWPRDGGVLFTGDAANNVHGLGRSPIYEDGALGIETLRWLSAEEFETACFTHGPAIVGGAAQAFRKIWGNR
jgi:glyoxylase-like metal-dependent hydrolase (beta-lactamase superfamily II)